jgi:hypothetical protein
MKITSAQRIANKKRYIPPMLSVKGDIASLTQQNKTFGASDGFFLVIPNSDGVSVPIANLS